MRVKFHNPDFPDELEFDVGGLLLVNNRVVEFDEEEVELFEARNGHSLKERLLNNPFCEVDGTQGEVTYIHPDTTESTEETQSEEEGDI